MSEELKPCPFCGGDWGIAQEPRDNHPVAGLWYLYHKAPRCFFAISPSHFETEASASAGWNTRAVTSHPGEDAVERAKAAMLPLVSEDMDPAMRDAWLGDLARAALSHDPQKEALVEALRPVMARLDTGRDAPGHCHDVPGIWDAGNAPEIAGKPCEWCAQWKKVRQALSSTLSGGR